MALAAQATKAYPTDSTRRRIESEIAADPRKPGYHEYRPGKTWAPAVNLYEDRKNFYVVADLPGMRGESIELDVGGGGLSIAGYRPTPPPPKVHGEMRLHHMEIDHGRFCRKIKLPAGVNVDAIEAVYRTGQLLVTLPKQV
jgi:HSP20 family protein